MSAEANKTLVRRFFEDVCNGSKLDIADSLFSADHTYHDPIIRAETGPEGIKRVVSPYHPAFTDLRWTVDDMAAAERDLVVTRWTGSGVHTDEVMGIPPTGKRVTVSGIWIHRIAGGKIAESWNMWDGMGMVRQLGAQPVLAQAGR